jgi:adenine phosphoribosyltransferase
VKNKYGGVYQFISFAVGERGTYIWPKLSKEVDQALLKNVRKLINENGQHYDRIITTDPGGFQWARPLSKTLNIPLSIWRREPTFIKPIHREITITYHTVPYHKRTLYFTDIHKLRNKRVLFVDDIISTGATMINIIKALREHDVLIGDAVCILTKSPAFINIEREFGINIHSMHHVTDTRTVTSRKGLETREPQIINECMLLYRKNSLLMGSVLKPKTKRLIKDTDIYGATIQTVQNFLTSTRPMRTSKFTTTRLGNLVIQKGKYIVIVVLLQEKQTTKEMRVLYSHMNKTIQLIESRLSDILPSWNGDIAHVNEALTILHSFAWNIKDEGGQHRKKSSK